LQDKKNNIAFSCYIKYFFMQSNKKPNPDKLKIVQDAASKLILFLLKIDDFSNNKTFIVEKIEEYITILKTNGSGRSQKKLPNIEELTKKDYQKRC